MTDCPNCEYHRQRAQLWRDEAYKQAGHPLPEQEPVAWISENAGLYHGKPDESLNPLPLYLGTRVLKRRIHELEGELIGYKKIVADQDAMLERQTARIVELQEHIENFDGEDR